MAKIDDLIKKAGSKLLEVQKTYEKNSKKLKDLIEQRGVLRASEEIGDITDADKLKIKKISAEIAELKIELEEAGTPLVTALKNKIVNLEKQKKDEELKEANDEQDKLEKNMHDVSVKLIPLLEKVVILNFKLREYWSNWTTLSEKTERIATKQKCSLGSTEMLNFCSSIIIGEWQGKKRRQGKFYNRISL